MPDAAGPERVESSEARPIAGDEGPERFRCRLFPTELEETIDTWDRSTPLGQWVLTEHERGWRIDDIELTVSRKVTGFVQPYAQICLVPR